MKDRHTRGHAARSASLTTVDALSRLMVGIGMTPTLSFSFQPPSSGTSGVSLVLMYGQSFLSSPPQPLNSHFPLLQHSVRAPSGIFPGLRTLPSKSFLYSGLPFLVRSSGSTPQYPLTSSNPAPVMCSTAFAGALEEACVAARHAAPHTCMRRGQTYAHTVRHEDKDDEDQWGGIRNS